MIVHLRGNIISNRDGVIVIDVCGVGYEVVSSGPLVASCSQIGQEVSIVVYTDMRDSSITLYGFCSYIERQVFLLLRKVNGVGPRIAMNIVSNLGAKGIYQSISSGDIAELKKVPGVGKKTAERIVVDLKEYVCSLIESMHSCNDALNSGNHKVKKKTKDNKDKNCKSEISGDDVFDASCKRDEEALVEFNNIAFLQCKNDAILALSKLGFSKEQAMKAVAFSIEQFKNKTSMFKDTSDILRVALSNISAVTELV